MKHEYTVRPATLETLADIHALLPDPQDRERRTADTRQRVQDGKVSPDQFLILRSERGVEGVTLISAAPQVPVFPRLRPDVAPEAMTSLARAVRERVEPERRLILQDDLAPLNRTAMEAAGWAYASTEVSYDTDLTARAYALAPFAQEGDEEWLEQPELQEFLRDLGQITLQFSGGFREGWTVVALREGSSEQSPILALGTYGPAKPGYGGVDMIGVHPRARGRGLGTRLHAHLLARLAPAFARHGGLTSADNHAMRRIFEKNGSCHVATQLYFTRS